MNLAELEKEYWGDQREQPTQVRLARVVKALREEAGPTIRMLEIQAAECFPEINERGQKHFVRVVMESAAEELKEILGDPEDATAGAIQPQGEESVRHISKEASPPETRRRSVAGPIEGPGNSAARDDQRSGTHPRAVASEDKAGRGRHVGGEGHHCLNEKAAGVARADELGIEVTGVGRREAAKQIHEQPEADIYDPSAPATTPAAGFFVERTPELDAMFDAPAADPSVCVWHLSNEVGALGFRWLIEPPSCGSDFQHEGYAKALDMRCFCGKPIKFLEG